MIGWLLVALGLAVWPGTGPAAARSTTADRAPSSSALLRSRRALQVIAAAGAAVLGWAVVGGDAGAVTAAALAPLGWHGAARLYGRASRPARDPALPCTLDLVAAVLRAGHPVSSALVLAAPTAGSHYRAALLRVGRLLALGADPADAWQSLAGDTALAELAATARRSANSGIRLAAAFDRAAVQVRAADRAAAHARASRAGAFAVAPLGLCFLPAFVCLGIVPVVVGIARTALAGQ